MVKEVLVCLLTALNNFSHRKPYIFIRLFRTLVLDFGDILVGRSKLLLLGLDCSGKVLLKYFAFFVKSLPDSFHLLPLQTYLHAVLLKLVFFLDL